MPEPQKPKQPVNGASEAQAQPNGWLPKQQAPANPLGIDVTNLAPKAKAPVWPEYKTQAQRQAEEEKQREKDRLEFNRMVEQGFSADNLFGVVTNVAAGGSITVLDKTVTNGEELASLLQDKKYLDAFYPSNAKKLALFNINTVNDLQSKLSGGLSEKEQNDIYNFGGSPIKNVYDLNPATLAAPKFGEIGYAPGQTTQYSNIYKQRTAAPNAVFSDVVKAGLNKTHDGRQINTAAEYYAYLQDPLNRDKYGRTYFEQIQTSGFASADDILKKSNALMVGGAMNPVEEQAYLKAKNDIRLDKADAFVQDALIGKEGTMFGTDGKEGLQGLTEADLGRIVYEHRMGNDISIDVKGFNYKTGPGPSTNFLDYDNLEQYLLSIGYTSAEATNKLTEFENSYWNTQITASAKAKAQQMGYQYNADTKEWTSLYGQTMDTRALNEMSEIDRNIAQKYDEIRAIYASESDSGVFDELNASGLGASAFKSNLSQKSQDRISKLQIEIAALKQKQGDTMPEFFDLAGNRIDKPEQQQTATTSYQAAMRQNKSSDLVDLKQKRNNLYEKIDLLKAQYDKYNSTLAIEGAYNPKYNVKSASQREDALIKPLETEEGLLAFIEKNLTIAGGPMGAQIMQSDSEVAMRNYVASIQSEYLRLQGEVKAINKLIHTNTDVFQQDLDSNFVANIYSKAKATVVSTIDGTVVLTPNQEVQNAASFFSEQGLELPDGVEEKLVAIHGVDETSGSVLNTLQIGLAIGAMAKGAQAPLDKLFTGSVGIATRSYMINRFGNPGLATFNLFKSAVNTYGVSAFAYEQAGAGWQGAIGETTGELVFDAALGRLALGRFMPTNIVGRMSHYLGRTFAGGTGELTQEWMGNVSSVFLENGFNLSDAVTNAFGETDDERLHNFRQTALMCYGFAGTNFGNLGLLFKTRAEYSAYLQQQQIDSEIDNEAIAALDNIIVSNNWNERTSPQNSPGNSMPSVNTTVANQSEVGIEKRNADIDEEFHLVEAEGVIDDKVTYRYNGNTGKLEARGLGGNTDEFVEVGESATSYVETKAEQHGIVSRQAIVDKVKTNFNNNPDVDAVAPDVVAQGSPMYQRNQSPRDKSRRTNKVRASAEQSFKAEFEKRATDVEAMFTGVSEQVDSRDANLNKVRRAYVAAVGNKLKTNVRSMFANGKTVVDSTVKNVLTKVADYTAPLLKDFDTNTNQTTDSNGNVTRKANNSFDRLKAAIARSEFYQNQIKKLVDNGVMTEEEAINNLAADMLNSDNSQVKALLDGDKDGVKAYFDFRREFNTFVANKYTGSNTFSNTQNFVRNTNMATSTTKNRKSDYAKETKLVAIEQVRRNDIARVLSASGQGIGVEHVDGIRYKKNEIGAREYLENMGEDLRGKTNEEIEQMAEAKAQAVDVDKYDLANELDRINEDTRKIRTKQIKGQLKNIWGLGVTSPRTLLQGGRKLNAAAYLMNAMYEANAQRMGITADEYAKNQIQQIKLTEDEFDALMQSQGISTALFQGVNQNAAQVTAHYAKAQKLIDSGKYTSDQIAHMTGFAIGEDGNLYPVKSEFNLSMFIDRKIDWFLENRLLRGLTAGISPDYKLGKSALFFGTSDFKTLGDVMTAKTFHPDVSKTRIEFIYSPGAPNYTFTPNELYTKGTNPGTISINLAQYKSSIDLDIDISKKFRSDVKNALLNSLYDVEQSINGEYDAPAVGKYQTPTDVRSTIKSAVNSNILTEEQGKFLNETLDFYIDNGLMQFTTYRNLFADVSSALLNKSGSAIKNKYGLDEQTTKALIDIRKRYDFGENPYQFIAELNRLASISNIEGIDVDLAMQALKLPTAKAKDKEIEAFAKSGVADNFITRLTEIIQNITDDIQTNSYGLTVYDKMGMDSLQVLRDALADLNYLNGELKKNPNVQKLGEFKSVTATLQGEIASLQANLGTDPGNGSNNPDIYDESIKNALDDFSIEFDEYRTNEIQKLFDTKQINQAVETTADKNSQAVLYSIYPGIQTHMNGLFDPFKKVSEYSKQELKSLLVPKFISDNDFEKTYSTYEKSPELYTGSAADAFLTTKNQVTEKEAAKSLEDAQKQAKLASIARNKGTSFYSNTLVAISSFPETEVDLDTLSNRLLNNEGVKSNQSELDFMNLDGFVDSMKADGKTKITKEELYQWALANMPVVQTFNASNAEFNPEVTDIVLMAPTNPSVGDYPSAFYAGVKLSTGETYTIDLKNIKKYFIQSPTSIGGISLYESGKLTGINADISSGGGASMFTIQNMVNLATKEKRDLTPEEKTQAQALLKKLFDGGIFANYGAEGRFIKAESKAGSGITTTYETRIAKGLLGGDIVDGTYAEDVFVYPNVYNNTLSKLYADLDAVNQEMVKLSNNPSPTNESQFKDLQLKANLLEKEIRNVTEINIRTATPMVGRLHWSGYKANGIGKNALISHVRRAVVNTEDGGQALFAIEIQSDVSSTIRRLVQIELKKTGLDPAVDLEAYNKKKLEIENDITAGNPTIFRNDTQYTAHALRHLVQTAVNLGLDRVIITDGGSVGEVVGALDSSIPGVETSLANYYSKTIPIVAKKALGNLKVRLDNPYNKIGQVNEATPTAGTKLATYTHPETSVAYQAVDRFYTIHITPETIDALNEGQPLYMSQGAARLGATVNMQNSQSIIYALTNPNVSTPLHEMAHVREQFLTPYERQVILDAAGHSTWTRETSEYFARGFEKYLYDGIAPNNTLSKIFSDFKKWMLDIYKSISGSEIDMQLNPEMRRVYDAMLGQATTTAQPRTPRTPETIGDKLGDFVKEMRENSTIEPTDDEIYTALMKAGFSPNDVQDYFILKNKAQIDKQKKGGPLEEEAIALEGTEAGITMQRTAQELNNEMENIHPDELESMMDALENNVKDGDIPLAFTIKKLLEAKANGNTKEATELFKQVMAVGTDVGRMLRLFRQLKGQPHQNSINALFKRYEKNGKKLAQSLKDKLTDIADKLDTKQQEVKAAQEKAQENPYGASDMDPNKTNLDVYKQLKKEYDAMLEEFMKLRQPFEGSESRIDLYRQFMKLGLMTPGSFMVNLFSNLVKFTTGIFVDPLSSAFSFGVSKVFGTEQRTKKGLGTFATGLRYGIPMGVKRGIKVLKDGTVVDSYSTPNEFVKSFNAFRSFVNFFSLNLALGQRTLGLSEISNEELSSMYGIPLNEVGKLDNKARSKQAMEATFGLVPEVVSRIMTATDMVFRDFAYMSTLAEQFKFTPEYASLKAEIESTARGTAARKTANEKMNKFKEAYLFLNSDYSNEVSSGEASRFVYTNNNMATEGIAGVQRAVTTTGPFMSRLLRILGTGIIPFTKIPTNYAVELAEFLMPEYALYKVASTIRNRKLRNAKKGISQEEQEKLNNVEARDLDRVMARAMVGTILHATAASIAATGALSSSAEDEDKEDRTKVRDLMNRMERPYSINISLLKRNFNNPNGDKLWKDGDKIYDYRSFGIYGASLFLAAKNYKDNLFENDMKYVNRGLLETAADNYFFQSGAVGSYLIDQTFVRGLNSFAQMVTQMDDEAQFAKSMANLATTIASGVMPNTLTFIDKMNRDYIPDYDAKDAPAFKMLGINVESPGMTTFWTQFAIKMAERWPFGDANKFQNLPGVEFPMDNIPVKVDPWGRPIPQTPEGAIYGKVLYNAMPLSKAMNSMYGYETPDWETLCYLAYKRTGDIGCMPSLPPKSIVDEFTGNVYKIDPDLYENYVIYVSAMRRGMIEEFVKSGAYKDMINPNSSLNKNSDGSQKLGKNLQPLGYQMLTETLKTLTSSADKLAQLQQYSLIAKERDRMKADRPDLYNSLMRKEAQSIYNEAVKEVYNNVAKDKDGNYAYDIKQSDIEKFLSKEWMEQYISDALSSETVTNTTMFAPKSSIPFVDENGNTPVIENEQPVKQKPTVAPETFMDENGSMPVPD